MAGNEINIKSSTIEKGMELAKEFLGKLISPTVEEIGLLLSDNVKLLRFKNQVRILLKAREYVKKRNISMKEIPVKILVPLLEKASLEEDEELHDKWAILIGNLADSETNLQNHVFPYLLSQISVGELMELEILFATEQQSTQVYENEKKRLREELSKEKGLAGKDSDLDQDTYFLEAYRAGQKINRLQEERNKSLQAGLKPELEMFELANLERLGLIKSLPPAIIIPEFKVNQHRLDDWNYINAEYDVNDYGYRLTALGEIFVKMCTEKSEQK